MLTRLDYALVYPGLGFEAVRRSPPKNHGCCRDPSRTPGCALIDIGRAAPALIGSLPAPSKTRSASNGSGILQSGDISVPARNAQRPPGKAFAQIIDAGRSAKRPGIPHQPSRALVGLVREVQPVMADKGIQPTDADQRRLLRRDK